MTRLSGTVEVAAADADRLLRERFDPAAMLGADDQRAASSTLTVRTNPRSHSVLYQLVQSQFMRWTNSIEIAATPETVWEITLDVEGLPALTTTVTEVERLDSGPLQVGSQTRLTQPRQRPRVWTVESLTAPNLFVWAAPMGRWRMVATHRITPSDDGCINELELELIGRGAGLVGRVIGRQIQASLATENEGFRRVAEERAAAGR